MHKLSPRRIGYLQSLLNLLYTRGAGVLFRSASEQREIVAAPRELSFVFEVIGLHNVNTAKHQCPQHTDGHHYFLTCCPSSGSDRQHRW